MNDGGDYNLPEKIYKRSEEKKQQVFLVGKVRKYCGIFRTKILKKAKLTSKST